MPFLDLEAEINKYIKYETNGNPVVNWKGIQGIETFPFINADFDELYRNILDHLGRAGILSKSSDGNYGLFLGECFLCLNPPRGRFPGEGGTLFFTREQDVREYRDIRYGDRDFEYKGVRHPVLIIKTEVIK